mgnify:CR=1 FL=1|jgi:colanic acid/amylovoran biosynthesis protein
MKVVITNFHSAANAGDLAILQVTIKQIRELFPGAEITVLANYPNEPALQSLGVQLVPSMWAQCGVNSAKSVLFQAAQFLLKWVGLLVMKYSSKGVKTSDRAAGTPLRKLFKTIIDADLVLACSGNQFYSTGRWGWPFPVNLSALWFAAISKRRMYILPQSIGPLKRAWERRALKCVYAKAKRVYLRDASSITLADEIGIPTVSTKYAPDPAFLLSPEPVNIAREYLQSLGADLSRPKLGVTVIARMGKALDQKVLDRYYQHLTQVLEKHTKETGAQVIVFTQVSGPSPLEDDRRPSRDLVRELVARGIPAFSAEGISEPPMLKALYGQMDVFLASRLHSGIFSTSMNVPTLFLGYLTKTKGMLRSLKIDAPVIDLAELEEDALASALKDIWAKQDLARVSLRRTIPEIVEASRLPLQEIQRDFEGGKA